MGRNRVSKVKEKPVKTKPEQGERDANGRFLPGHGSFKAGNPGKPKGAIHQITRIKNAFKDAFEVEGKGKSIIEGFRDSRSLRNQKVFIDWIISLVGNGKEKEAVIVIYNQVIVNVSEVIKHHVKDPAVRNRIATELDKLA